MSQKPLKTTVICITVVLIIWITHSSLCEFRFRIAGRGDCGVLTV
ncbi:Hok/Gef family protein [Escherichia coli]